MDEETKLTHPTSHPLDIIRDVVSGLQTDRAASSRLVQPDLPMITQPEKLPQQTHFAAIVFKTRIVHHEGDERSRTNPGHGYPAYKETIHVVEYIPFNSQQEMEQWVIKVETAKYDQPKYRLIEARPLSVEISTTVAID